MADTLPHREFIMPTPKNFIRLFNTNLMDNLRRRQDSDAALPSLYRRAYMMAYNTGEILVEFSHLDTEET